MGVGLFQQLQNPNKIPHLCFVQILTASPYEFAPSKVSLEDSLGQLMSLGKALGSLKVEKGKNLLCQLPHLPELLLCLLLRGRHLQGGSSFVDGPLLQHLTGG